MKIFLMRHGESMQNTRENIEIKLPDHKVYLTENGKDQVHGAGRFLKDFVVNEGIDLRNAKLWNSPFCRTRQSKSILNEYLGIENTVEEALLIEERYGRFSDEHWSVLREKYPEEFAHYDLYYQNEGKFYAKKAQGDAPLDVYVRAKLFNYELFQDMYFDGIDTHFVVAHGSFIKCFIMSCMGYPPEWFSETKPMDNRGIAYIEREKRKVKTFEYIYPPK